MDDSMSYLKQMKQTMVNRELLKNLTALHSKARKPLGFNSLAKVGEGVLSASLSDKQATGKQANIFSLMATKNFGNPKALPTGVPAIPGGANIFGSRVY